MSAKEEIVIKDSCTIIDHCELGLLDIFFSMDLSVHTTPNVVGEITDPDQAAQVRKYIDNGRLQVNGTGEMVEIARIQRENPALSSADASVLELAIRMDAIVLTSDGSLRRVTQAQNLRVKGSVWVIEEMVTCGLLTKEAALQKLEEYATLNLRAPKKEITALIDNLRKEKR